MSITRQAKTIMDTLLELNRVSHHWVIIRSPLQKPSATHIGFIVDFRDNAILPDWVHGLTSKKTKEQRRRPDTYTAPITFANQSARLDFHNGTTLNVLLQISKFYCDYYNYLQSFKSDFYL